MEVEARLDDVEELLAGGLPAGHVARTVAAKYGVTPRQVKDYIGVVYRRWEAERSEDAPYRREKLLRKVERFYATCLREKKYGPAAAVLVLEARMTGAFDHAEVRERLLAELGPPPAEAGAALAYVRRALLAMINEALSSPHLDLQTRHRIVSDMAFKLAATQSRADVELALSGVEGMIRQHQDQLPAADVIDADAAGWGTAPGARAVGPRALPEPEEDEEKPPPEG